MWNPATSPRTPILYEHWVSEGEFSYWDATRHGSSPSQMSLTEGFITPVSSRDQNCVIIPLHSPLPKLEQSNVKPTKEIEGRSTPPSNFSSPIIRVESGSQAHRRSPEKRFLSPGPICRICHDGDKEETLLSPCNCSGSMQLVHKSCLEKWLSASNSEHCELCMKELPVRKEARPVWQWFSMTSSADGPQGFYADLTCVILLTPLCLLSIYLCAIGAADYMKHGVWEGTGLAALSCFLLGTYVIWCYITIRFHWQTLQKWKTSNQVVHLLVKDCKRRDQILSRVSDSSTPKSTLIHANGWNSPPEVHVFLPTTYQNSPSEIRTNHPNVMDSSIRGFIAPSFL
ncbi:E3 ubiquitin-protein ligase MARCHF8-like isoform X2 [Frankliniella occidentalis]|uniref:E3 ubiquitin-protein ligase MARCHF8-like isoform X2 n=1 Tax=Frankliniella occidentalis TaxID=133901 RepID=A0A6J1T2Q1_FRAOC|nr:E3 ubiquitin-protein ligase MARCHF8-like isoform X2 [Frankliniella occidentalis]